MERKLEEIKKHLTPELEKLNIIITDITYSKKGKYSFLTIELDKEGGLDLDTIVDASNVINPIIDKLDLIDDSYILDVISKERG